MGGVFIFRDDPVFCARLLDGTKQIISALLDIATAASLAGLKISDAETTTPAAPDQRPENSGIQRSASSMGGSGDYSSKVWGTFINWD